MKYYGRNEACIRAYVDQLSPDGKTPNGNVWFRGDVIYSYGEHFPMAVRLGDGFYILNGDRYSVTTSQHQGLLFQAIPNSRRVEIPFSALRSLFNTERLWVDVVSEVREIKVVDWKVDRWEPTDRFDKNGDRIYDHVLGGCLFEWSSRKFLSSLDETGRRNGLFFLTELVDPGVMTVDEALESLKPDVVKAAESGGEVVKRQGEWFFVQVHQISDEFVREAEKNYVLRNADPEREDRHFATRGFRLGDRQFVQGVVRHSENDHPMLRLYEVGTKVRDRQWFEAFENIQVNSWSALGDVD